jgi:thiol-disulfide isomerase/thioredoxin
VTRRILALVAGVGASLLVVLGVAGGQERWSRPVGAQLAGGTQAVLSADPSWKPVKLTATFLDPDGAIVEGGTLVSGPTLLFYFSANCSHCQQVTPELIDLARRVGGRATVVGIASSSNSLQEIRNYREAYAVPFPIVKDFSRKFATENRCDSTPQLLMIRPMPGQAAAYETLGEYRPLPPGGALLADMRLRTALGQDPWSAFEKDRYQGVRACAGCHLTEWASWGLTFHSTAFWTLYEAKKDADPACVRCHVTGYGEETGHRLGDPLSAMVDVGCEACHGPGGPHDGAREPLSAARERCAGCHDDEHSLRFDLGAAWPHIDHWRAEPLSPEAWEKERALVLDGRAEKPLARLPKGRTVGSEACQSCHAEAWAWWKGNPHGRARESLKRKAAGADAGCLACHATGKVDEPKSAADFHVGGVGCEDCHGPGEVHVRDGGGKGNILRLGGDCPVCVIDALCTRCHTPEQDKDWNVEVKLGRVGHR